MNERIKELALQAGGSHYPDVNTAQLEKFAELIIQDCADLAYSYNIFGRGRAWNLIIKEHFGLPVVDADLPPYLKKQGVE
jgi:hypothetical protein